MFTLLIITLLFSSSKKMLLKAVNFVEKFELHHKIISFIGLILLTILFVRLGVTFYDPSPLIFGFEIHHFDYGMVMLLILTVLLLFDRNRERFPLYLLLSAVSVGLVIDELWYLRAQDAVTKGVNIIQQPYNKSTGPVIVLFIFIVLLTIVINHKRRKR